MLSRGQDNAFLLLFVFERRPLISLRYLRWTYGLQLRMRDNTQSVLRDCSAFFSSQPTTLCRAMLPNCQPLRGNDLPECKGQGSRLRCSLRQITTFFRHPIPGVVSNLTQLLLIARYIQQSREIRHHLNNEQLPAVFFGLEHTIIWCHADSLPTELLAPLNHSLTSLFFKGKEDICLKCKILHLPD